MFFALSIYAQIYALAAFIQKLPGDPAGFDRPLIPPSWGGILGLITGLIALATVFYKAGRHENKVEKIADGLRAEINGFGIRMSSEFNGLGSRMADVEKEQGILTGIVSTLEGLTQKQLGLYEGLTNRVADYQRETSECSAENRRLRAEITSRLETISVQVARVETELKNVNRQ